MTTNEAWWLEAVFYEVRVRSYRDGNGDGVGDFRGLTDALGHIEALGVNALWLMPTFPSPLVDDGYDVSDYCAVHPDLGTLEDFREFLAAAHARGIRVVLDLVLNHTSDEHAWFRASRTSHDAPMRDWYVWSDDDTRYAGVPVIFSGVETSNWAWDEHTRQFWWHRFFARQPDLNYDHEPVREAMWDVLRFWLDLGVDGFRVDAVPYLYEREGTLCEGLPETHALIREYRRRMDERYHGRLLLAEACQEPESLVPYFGGGAEFHMAFHFPLVPQLFLALHREDREPVVRTLTQMPALPGGAQWATFLRNHDECSLALATAADADELFAAYAAAPGAKLYRGIRRRLAALLAHDDRRVLLMHAVLLALPGTPFLYYGDEVGLTDDLSLPDRDGVRLPMPWRAADERTSGASVERQEGDERSLLERMRRLIRARRAAPGLGTGAVEFLSPRAHEVLAFTRAIEHGTLVFAANLSGREVHTTLALTARHAHTMRDVLSGERHTTGDDGVLALTLGPFAFAWLRAEAGA